MERIVKSPRRVYYFIGGAALVLSVIGFIVCVIFLINQIASSTPQIKVVVPGTQNIYFSESGVYTVYYEYRSVVNNKIYSTGEELPSNILVTLTREKNNEEIALSQPSMNETYESGGHAGVSVFAFEITEPGYYVFTAHYAGDGEHPEIIFGIGQSKLFGTVFSGLALFFVSFILFIIGTVIIIVTFFKRRKSERQN